MTGSCPGPEATEQLQNHNISITMLHSCYEVLLLKFCLQYMNLSGMFITAPVLKYWSEKP